jgi:iron complex transport system ATP-binding protein
MNSAILQCRNLTYRSADGRALVQGVTLDVDRHDRLAIIGPNGAGKSTLLNMMAGLLRRISGDLWLAGRSMARLAPIERARQIAVVGQSDQPDPRLAVIDYVELGRVPHLGRLRRDEERDVVVEALRRTGLLRFHSRSIGSLSGGERKRVQLARAIAQQPKLDEPTNHLDPRARGELLELLGDLGTLSWRCCTTLRW